MENKHFFPSKFGSLYNCSNNQWNLFIITKQAFCLVFQFSNGEAAFHSYLFIGILTGF